MAAAIEADHLLTPVMCLVQDCEDLYLHSPLRVYVVLYFYLRVLQGSFTEITGERMIMGSRQYGARFGTAVANVGDLNLDGYEGKQWSNTLKMHP